MGVKVHRDKRIELKSIVREADIDKSMTVSIATSLKCLAVQNFPVGIELIEQAVMTNKESIDREKALQALLSLYPPDDERALVYSNEASVKPSSQICNAVHGNLDLLLGLSSSSQLCKRVQRKDLCLSETKGMREQLCARRMNKYSSGPEEWDLATTSQPVIQVILVGQIQQHLTACFTMTRERFRPFLYFPKEDVLLTTLRSFAWVYENRLGLGLRGYTLLAILLRDIWKTWRPKSIPPTNFLQAWKTRKLGDIVDNFTIEGKK
jgi:hypothetical protein